MWIGKKNKTKTSTADNEIKKTYCIATRHGILCLTHIIHEPRMHELCCGRNVSDQRWGAPRNQPLNIGLYTVLQIRPLFRTLTCFACEDTTLQRHINYMIVQIISDKIHSRKGDTCIMQPDNSLKIKRNISRKSILLCE